MVNSNDYYIDGRTKAEIIITFTTTRILYATGSIEIKFHSSYVPYSHCRSNIA